MSSAAVTPTVWASLQNFSAEKPWALGIFQSHISEYASFICKLCKGPISSEVHCIIFSQVFAFFKPKVSFLCENIVLFYLVIAWKTKSQLNSFSLKNFNFYIYIYIYRTKSILNCRHVVCHVLRPHVILTSGDHDEPPQFFFSPSSMTFLKNGISLTLSRLILEFCSKLLSAAPPPL